VTCRAFPLLQLPHCRILRFFTSPVAEYSCFFVSSHLNALRLFVSAVKLFYIITPSIAEHTVFLPPSSASSLRASSTNLPSPSASYTANCSAPSLSPDNESSSSSPAHSPSAPIATVTAWPWTSAVPRALLPAHLPSSGSILRQVVDVTIYSDIIKSKRYIFDSTQPQPASQRSAPQPNPHDIQRN
jgi:hypothetical protein